MASYEYWCSSVSPRWVTGPALRDRMIQWAAFPGLLASDDDFRSSCAHVYKGTDSIESCFNPGLPIEPQRRPGYVLTTKPSSHHKPTLPTLPRTPGVGEPSNMAHGYAQCFAFLATGRTERLPRLLSASWSATPHIRTDRTAQQYIMRSLLLFLEAIC